jgi:hypothetical protein
VTKIRSIFGGRRPPLTTTLMVRESAWEIRQLYTPEQALVGDLIVLYAPTHVRAIVVLRAEPLEAEWESLDSFVLAQIDNYERRYVIDYYEGRFLTGLEGPPERPDGNENEMG